jgi:glycosyltransferase involved in cell wall biosynthesis
MDLSMDKTRVLLAAPLPPPTGGIAVWTGILLRDMHRHPDIEIHHVDTALRWKKRVDLNIKTRLIGGILQAFWDIVRVGMALVRYRPHVLHLTTSAGFASVKDAVILYLARRLGAAGYIHYHTSILGNGQLQGWQLRAAYLAMRFAAQVLVLDAHTHTALQPRIPAHKLQFVPNMIELERLDEVCARRVKSGGETTPGEGLRCVYVGRVVADKGIVEQLQACAQLPGVRLDIVGPVDAEYRQYLQHMARDQKQRPWLYFHGGVDHDEVYGYIQQSDVLLLPSYHEAFPYVVLEGMALGKPVVVSNVGAMPEMIDAAGDQPCGLCVAPRDADALRDALQQLIDVPAIRRAMGQAGRRRVEYLYDIPPVLRQIKALWQIDHAPSPTPNLTQVVSDFKPRY